MQCVNNIKVGATLTINLQRVSGETPYSLINTDIESYISHTKFGKYDMDVEIIDAIEGRVRLTLDSDISSRVIPGNYTWTIIFTDSDGNVEIFPKDNSTIIAFNK